MGGLRRAAVAVILGGLVGLIVRLRGMAGTPAQQGGWRELDGSELR